MIPFILFHTFFTAILDLFAFTLACERFMGVAILALPKSKDFDWFVFEGKCSSALVKEFSNNIVSRWHLNVIHSKIKHWLKTISIKLDTRIHLKIWIRLIFGFFFCLFFNFFFIIVLHFNISSLIFVLFNRICQIWSRNLILQCFYYLFLEFDQMLFFKIVPKFPKSNFREIFNLVIFLLQSSQKSFLQIFKFILFWHVNRSAFNRLIKIYKVFNLWKDYDGKFLQSSFYFCTIWISFSMVSFYLSSSVFFFEKFPNLFTNYFIVFVES